ncbi:DMT family transporter [Candidatus Bipolaricaulota bacterium]|nr:DMT family transporter [Candidatus Bipolaricaulota bacterium]
MSVAVFSTVLAVIVGVVIAAQTLFAGTLGHRVGLIESVFIIHLGGFLISGVYLLITGGGNLGAWRAAPWYVLCGGFLGVVIIGGYGYVIPRIGLASSITLAVSAQLIFSAILNHYGVLGAVQHPITLPRVMGILVLLVGTWLIVR